MKGVALALLLLACTGCFSARSGVERYHRRVRVGMETKDLLRKLGKPVETVPVPGQGSDPELAVEQWRYAWDLLAGQLVTGYLTLGIGFIFMDYDAFGFDVGIGRDGRVRAVTEVYRRK
ncbi:MAG TPA: hypothetical protein VEJ18_22480 [Planctomycetota bacterium]|nr:hypothetical protein [Planctomycetota bacterium]